MGSTGRGVSTYGNGGSQPTVVPTVTQATQANNSNFPDTDDRDYHELVGGRQYFQNQTIDVDTMIATQDYLSDQPTASSIYAPSQQLNYAMEHGQPLTANQQYMVDSLMNGMHNLGENLTLTHYGRVSLIDNFARNIGANINSNNFENMSIAQLKQAFVGSTHSLQKFLSTSHNDFRNAPNNGAPFTDKAVKLAIKAPARTQAYMPGNGPGGALGEMIVAPGQNFRITDVRFTGVRGRSGANTYKQIEFDIEFY